MYVYGQPYCDRCLEVVGDDDPHRWDLDGTRYHLCFGCRTRIVEVWLAEHKEAMHLANRTLTRGRRGARGEE